MSREIRMKVPISISATCHYVAQVLGCPVQEVYATLLYVSVTRMTNQEALDWVREGRPLYQIALQGGAVAGPGKEG